jgi:signal recognition particle GTPase
MKHIIIIILSLICLNLKAQEFPKPYYKKGLWIITEPQLKATIKLSNDAFMCEEKMELYKNLNEIKDKRINAFTEKIYLYDEKIDKLELILKEKDKQLDIKDKIITEYKKELRQQKVKRIVGGTIAFGLGAIGGVVATTYLLR